MAASSCATASLDFRPLLVGHQPAIDHQVGQRSRRFVDPGRACLRQAIRVDRAVLECDDAEEQVALGIHDSLTRGVSGPSQ